MVDNENRRTVARGRVGGLIKHQYDSLNWPLGDLLKERLKSRAPVEERPGAKAYHGRMTTQSWRRRCSTWRIDMVNLASGWRMKGRNYYADWAYWSSHLHIPPVRPKKKELQKRFSDGLRLCGKVFLPCNYSRRNSRSFSSRKVLTGGTQDWGPGAFS